MNCTHTIQLLLCGFLLAGEPLAVSSARGVSEQKAKAGSMNASAKEKIDVCRLLSSAEIEAVQGEPVKETRASMQPSGGMLMSQCVFQTARFEKSVNVALATPSRAGKPGFAPREFWKKQFHSKEAKEKETRVAGKVSEPEHEEAESKARPIDGLGEEAYWVSNPIAGALYVLHGEEFLRISVGGVREEPTRIEKSKALAHAIMKRL